MSNVDYRLLLRNQDPFPFDRESDGLRIIPAYSYATDDGDWVTVGARLKNWWKNDPLPLTWNVNTYWDWRLSDVVK